MLDLDNTLGNRTSAVHTWVGEFCAEHELPPDAAEWILRADNDGYSARTEVFAELRDHFGLAEPVSDLVSKYQRRVIELAAPTVGAIECLRSLRSMGHTLAIVTNGSSGQQHGKIDTAGFRPMVDAVIVSGDLDIKKPDPRIFEAAAQATGQPLRGSWMVGDSATHDVLGAHVLGASTAWLHRDRDWPGHLSCRPTVILDDLTQLVAAITAHG